jgi:Arc/MetJ-type ribon-helix-helix transcriptional regulator
MMYGHTRIRRKETGMTVAKIAITLDQGILGEVDRLVRRHVFPNRSRAIQEAVREKVTRLSVNRLARECAKLDPKAEQAIAEEGMSEEVVSWPEY